jgi:hypothetical protein
MVTLSERLTRYPELEPFVSACRDTPVAAAAEMEALVVRMANQQNVPAREERWTVALRPACSLFHGRSHPIFAGKWLTPLRVPTVPSVPR